MTRSFINIRIDRIAIRGLDPGSQRAEEIRAGVGFELQRIIEQEGLPEGASGADLLRVSAPPIGAEGPTAKGIARSIRSALNGARR